MPKRLPLQRRGKAKPKFKPRTFRSVGTVRLPSNAGEGVILDILHDNFKTAPLMVVDFSGEICLLAAVKDVRVGEKVAVSELQTLVEGTVVSSVEIVPRAGPKLGRSGGNGLRVISQDSGFTTLQLPSKKTKKIHGRSLAVVGRVGGGGRKEKPLLKAGVMFHRMKNRAGIWPKTVGGAKNTVDHPFGGGKRSPGRSKSTSRHAPAGRKVGSIAPRRTGKK